MSYLLDKKKERKNVAYTLISVIVLLVLFYFRSNISNGLAYFAHGIFRPVLVLGNGVGEKINQVSAYFISKNSLFAENENLKSQLEEDKATMANYDSVLADNTSLKEILDRKAGKANMVLSAILEKPNQSLYDTLVIDAGIKQGLMIGDTVFALGNVPIGNIAQIYQSSSKVVLFSNPGEKTKVIIGAKHISLEALGRGGGNFEIILPRDYTPAKGDQVVLPGINSYVLGIVQTIISDPRDPFVKALLTSPVNVQELKFVEVEKF